MRWIWPRAFGLGFAIGAAPLAVAHVVSTATGGPYQLRWSHILVWWVGLLLATMRFGSRHPGRAWSLAFAVESGLIVAVIADIAFTVWLGIPHTVWPLMIVLAGLLTAPVVALGTSIGRARSPLEGMGRQPSSRL